MTKSTTAQNIFRSIHEGKWLSIEYKNKEENITRYWIAIHQIDMRYKGLRVEGFHLGDHTVMSLYIYVDSILSSAVVEGSYYEAPRALVEDLDGHPEKYEPLFGHAANLKILNYLVDCNRLDTQPYQCDYSLVSCLDKDRLSKNGCFLTEEQFSAIVSRFQEEAADKRAQTNYRLKQLCMNVLSVPVRGTKRGNGQESLYVLAYRRLYLDVKKRMLKPAEDITICREFTIDGEKQSIRKFLEPCDFSLLDEFEKNQEEIKDRITESNREINGVDDRPYIIALASDVKVDLNTEYGAILKMFEEDAVTEPVKAFFGKMTGRPVRKKDYPLALLKRQANLDQLLAIHNAMKYPITYVQGPPGTGKSYTIVNTIVTAFFNEKTVLLSSYNNHPLDTVVESLKTIEYHSGKMIPFPVLRLGNEKVTKKSLKEIRELYENAKKWNVYESTLDKNRGDKIQRTQQLTALLKKHEEILALREQKESIESLLKVNRHLTFQTDLQGRQLAAVEKRLREIGRVTDEEALSLLTDDEQSFRTYLNFTSVKYIKRLGEPKNEELLKIIYMDEEKAKLEAFNAYLSKTENVKKLLRIFPVVATTCISAHRLGGPEACFDMTIIDEASQCNLALSLVPILRGKNLMLVGDPQQLSPVILLDAKDNEALRKRYLVSEEYDYRKNSIYKTFLACDAVSDEILLRHHYRCDRRIINFNNIKYYNSRLNIESRTQSPTPLLMVDVGENHSDFKNTSPREAEEIVEYVKHHRDKEIGIITPFANQKEYIGQLLKENDLEHATCGTVHAFQGDEKDVILFSLALTDRTTDRTYQWLKNNQELINVATSRAKEQLVILGSGKNLERLHREGERDDVYELVEYVKTNGQYRVTPQTPASRALGIRPYSTETEEEFLKSLNLALDNVLNNNGRCSVKKEVAISQVFQENITDSGLFYTGRFDFVIYEHQYGGRQMPILAVELDGKEHMTQESVRKRDEQKKKICREHGFELIRVENSYARRYYYIKQILESYFKGVR